MRLEGDGTSEFGMLRSALFAIVSRDRKRWIHARVGWDAASRVAFARPSRRPFGRRTVSWHSLQDCAAIPVTYGYIQSRVPPNLQTRVFLHAPSAQNVDGDYMATTPIIRLAVKL